MDCKEKLEEAKRLYKFSNDDQRHVLEDLFPELKESEDEDEKIRIAILNYLRKMWANCKDNVCGVHIEDAIAWLEKQGEQKLINKIEPKFKVGDTIVEKDFYECGYGTIKDIKNGQYIFTDGSSINIDEQEGWQLSTNVEAKFKVGDWIIYDENIYQIHNIGLKQYYECLRTDGTVHIFDFEYIDSKSHFWTIQDAKDGDVLVTIDDKQPFIYKGCLDPNHPNLPVAYCGLDSEGYFIRSCVDKFNHWWTDEKIQPATKEQCGLLFQKMKKAGYEWDAKNNVLKKIDTYCQERCKGYQETGKCFADGECEAKKEAEQKSAWSEEDEDMLYKTTVILNKLCAKEEEFVWSIDTLKKLFYWLKSLKDRVQPKQEWSDEDIRNIENIDSVLFYDKDLPEDTCVRLRNWLESLKGRVQPKQEWSEEDEKMFSELSSSLLINISDQWVKYGKWLKSLKGRITWKPTVEQLASLTIACDRNDRVGFDLTQLLEELKKL